jgi:hypothetical protein
MAAEPLRTNDMSGRWIGQWRSDVNGHHGALRCIITPHTTNASMARFRARFWKIFAAGYAVPLGFTNVDSQYTFGGEANLGALMGGTYSCKGTGTPTSFNASYSSKYDRGFFFMRRPEPNE